MINPAADKMKWIKITVDIFDDEKIRIIESLPDPDAIIVIWFKLLTLAGKCNNSGVIMLSDKIAYTPAMLSTLFNRPINIINYALETFEKFGMIAVEENGAISIPKWEKHQSIEKYEKSKELHKIRQQKYREKQKLISQGKSDVTVTSRDVTEVEVEEEVEEEVEVVNNSTTTPSLTDIQNFIKANNLTIDADHFFDYYEAKNWKGVENWKKALFGWEKREFKNQKENTAAASYPVENDIKQVSCSECGNIFYLERMGKSLFGGTCNKCNKYQEIES